MCHHANEHGDYIQLRWTCTSMAIANHHVVSYPEQVEDLASRFSQSQSSAQHNHATHLICEAKFDNKAHNWEYEPASWKSCAMLCVFVWWSCQHFLAWWSGIQALKCPSAWSPAADFALHSRGSAFAQHFMGIPFVTAGRGLVWMKVSCTSTDQSYLRASTDSMTCAVTQTDHVSQVACSTIPHPYVSVMYWPQ